MPPHSFETVKVDTSERWQGCASYGKWTWKADKVKDADHNMTCGDRWTWSTGFLSFARETCATVGKNRIRQLLLFTLDPCIYSQIPSLCQTGVFCMRCFRLRNCKPKMFLVIPNCTAGILYFLVEMSTTQTQHILAQIKDGSWANFLLHTLFHFSHIKPKTLNMLLQQPHNDNHKRPFRYHSKK